MTPTPLPASPLDRYALARLQQRPTGSSWLDMLPLEAVCRLTETTGAILRHGIRFDPLTPDGTEWSACAAEGYAITSEGPERFSDFLQSLIKASYRSSTERRPLKIFGRLAELVQSADPLSPYKAVRELMQTVSVAELPLGPGDKFLGTVRERKLHSLSSAATASGLSRVEIRAQLRKANIITSDTENFPDHKVLFPCQALDNIGRPTRCSTKEAMGRLNATGDELAALVRARLLLPVQGKRFQAIEFSDNDVERILGHIQALPLITLEEAPMTRVSSAATVSQRSIATVLKLVLDGSVRAATTGETGLAGLLVDPVECAQARSKYKLKELPWRRAMAALQVPSRTLEVLLSKGYLEGNTTGEQLDFTITTDALIRFAREYVSMREITHQLRFAYPHLAAKVAMRAHPPATPWTIAHANFYRRSEIVT